MSEGGASGENLKGACRVELPQGWTDGSGRRVVAAVMRPARVRDEVRSLEDFRVWLRPQAFSRVLLSRVVCGWVESEGTLRARGGGSPLERLGDEDIAVLETAYARMNGYEAAAP